MVFVAAGRECVRCWIIDDVDLRLRKPSGDREIFDDAMQLFLLCGIGRHRADRAYRDRSREPVRPDIRQQRKTDGEVENGGIAEILRRKKSHDDHEREKHPHEEPGAEYIARLLSV